MRCCQRRWRITNVESHHPARLDRSVGRLGELAKESRASRARLMAPPNCDVLSNRMNMTPHSEPFENVSVSDQTVIFDGEEDVRFFV